MYKPNICFRIIEIAGGREIFSQSRSKAVRKARNLMNSDEFDKKKSNKSPTSQSVWELRGSYDEERKLKTAREFTETIFSSEVCSVKHQRVEQQFENSSSFKVMSSPIKEPERTGADIVIFDDIGDNLQDFGALYLGNNKLEINEVDTYELSSTGMCNTFFSNYTHFSFVIHIVYLIYFVFDIYISNVINTVNMLLAVVCVKREYILLIMI